MPATVGVRELKAHLSRYLRLVRSGRRIVVTDNGRPVAELRAIPRTEEDEDKAILEELAALGKVRLGNGKPLTAFKPVAIRGKPLSETLVEMREDRI
jgi:antitoxin (DNA-binding transcriptional repressor) of toxin-antitoxin stability system